MNRPLFQRIGVRILSLIIAVLTWSVSFAGGEAMLRTVELEGSYYEIGQGWGTVFKEEMEKVTQIELNIIAAFYQTDIEGVISMGRKYLPAAEQYDPDFMEVLHGFADGACIEFETLFAIRAVLEILFYSKRPEGMCTSFAVTGNATKNGQTIIGQNIDWHPGLPMALLRIQWPNGVKQLALSMGGIWEYSLSSHISESPFGIAATLTATPDQDSESTPVPISIVMNRAARQTSLEKALAVFTAAKTNLASFLLANGKGDIKGVELGLNDFVLIQPERDTLVHANHYESERLKPYDIFVQYVPDSPMRRERLADLLIQDYGKVTENHLMEYLADHNNAPKGICSHVDPASDLPPSATLASVIMVPERKRMYVAPGNPCENGYVPYDLENK